MDKDDAQRPVTLRDVAAAAGVNQSTVSRAMRGDPRLRPETRRQIRELARRMGYRPNPFVTALTAHVRNRSASPLRATIAVLDTFTEDSASLSWLVTYENGIRRRAAELGFGVDTLRLGETGLGLAAAGKIVASRGIRGLIVLPVKGRSAVTGIDFGLLAGATIDPSLRRPPLHRVSPDYFQGIQLAMDTLHARRYRRIGFCTSREEVRRIGHLWLGGCLAWHAQGLPEERVNPYIGTPEKSPRQDPETAGARWIACRDAFARWLEKEKPDAVVGNDLSFENWLRELGFRVPGDVAFASLGVRPGDTSRAGIDQRGEQVGAAAVDIVAGQIWRNEYGLPPVPKTVLIPSVWVDGGTCT
jgi:LacI family transcriptional regulator